MPIYHAQSGVLEGTEELEIKMVPFVPAVAPGVCHWPRRFRHQPETFQCRYLKEKRPQMYRRISPKGTTWYWKLLAPRRCRTLSRICAPLLLRTCTWKQRYHFVYQPLYVPLNVIESGLLVEVIFEYWNTLGRSIVCFSFVLYVVNLRRAVLSESKRTKRKTLNFLAR